MVSERVAHGCRSGNTRILGLEIKLQLKLRPCPSFSFGTIHAANQSWIILDLHSEDAKQGGDLDYLAANVIGCDS